MKPFFYDLEKKKENDALKNVMVTLKCRIIIYNTTRKNKRTF